MAACHLNIARHCRVRERKTMDNRRLQWNVRHSLYYLFLSFTCLCTWGGCGQASMEGILMMMVMRML